MELSGLQATSPPAITDTQTCVDRRGGAEGGGHSKMNGDGDDCVFVCVCDGKRAINRLSIKADVQPAPPLPPVELVWVRMGVYGTLRGEREGCEEVNVCPSQ